MRIAILSETFAKNMGYMGNMLPRHLARLGAEVHMVTLDLPPYYQIKDFKETYQDFTGSSVMKAGSIEEYDGYRLHVLGHKPLAGYMYMSGLSEKLKEIRPDVVYSMAAIGWIALQAALLKPLHGYKLFTGSHTTASVFPLATQKNSPLHPALIRNAITRGVPGRMVSLLSEKCYGATGDCADVAVRFFGVQKSKIDVCPLGVDTDMFRPLQGSPGLELRREVRARFGVRDEEILCIYTGRFSQEKNPLVLAKAVAKLQAMGEPYRALFFGNGVQLEEIRAQAGCIPHPFVPVEELGDYFRASDIGVWPTQESTSMLDAAACGLPIVVNDTLLATERVEGNGVMYRLNDVDDMVRVLLSLKQEEVRKRLGAVGAEKMRSSFSWESIARRRLDDMKSSVSGRGI
ncbi:glycosyltransferase family 4 protein [Geomonas paludis]|uniref:Glycosyltransferase family 4 protein n=1 Tax=Geomonas paludis TaxID=2740185 RepID=A0ABY4LI18_9BACT|nr:glycosyltransferase family 4 protein [Geomonas paludis]UPU37638.1 glycosyltransferase family 4 protein [Geomonas paludis]